MFKKILKWSLIVIGILIVVIATSVYFLSAKTDKRISKIYSVTPQMISIPSDSASVEKGRYLAHVLCAECHGGAGFSGKRFFDDPKLGRIDAPNLTRGVGGIGASFSDEDWIRVLRDGVKPDGKAVFVMPAKDFNAMSEADLGCVIAYMKTIPPVNKEWSKTIHFTTFAKVLIALGAFGDVIAAESIDHNSRPETAPTQGPTIEYGNYMVKIFGCRTCHGINLNGGKHPDPNAPFSPNLTKGGELGKWDLNEFKTAMRTGKTPDNRMLTEYMPWRALANMKDEDLEAVYHYIQSLPGMETASK
jgi:mono/diheme cytochrome c family protein